MRFAVLLALAVAVPAGAATLLDDSARVDDDVVALVHDAAAAALAGTAGALPDVVTRLERLDDARRDAGLAPTGLTDDVRLIAAGLHESRDARHDALEAVLDRAPDPVVRRVAEYALEREDDRSAADRLLEDDRHNRRASVLNDAVRPLGVFSGAAVLAVLNPFLIAGSALDSVATTAVNLYHYNDLSPTEREALVRYRRGLARDADTPDAPAIAATARGIDARRAAALCAGAVDAARQALDAGDLDRARYFVAREARALDCAGAIDDVRERLARALAARAARDEAARWPADDAPRPTEEERPDHDALVAAVALADPGGMMADAQRFLRQHPDSDLADGATLSIAVARDLAGHGDEARDALARLARRHDGAGRAAAVMLATPRFDHLATLGDAERRHAREVAEYVLVGGGPSGRSLLYTVSQFGAQGVQAAESLGIFNVIGLLSRAWGAWRHDPASNQAIIDEGERFLAREPGAREASDVHERLAAAYERAGAYDRALLHYRAVTDPKPGRLAALESKVADRLLENAEKANGEPALLEAVARYYPATDAAEKARKALAKMPAPGDIVLSRDALAKAPALLGPNGLDLDPHLFDGDLRNGELADAGVTVSRNTLRLSLRNPDGGDDRIEERALARDVYERVRAAAVTVLYDSTLLADHGEADTGRFERYIPFSVNGDVGESGNVSIAPAVKLRKDRTDDQSLYQ
jgi:tetratricopeptide (TPR) repeat protein